MGGLGQHKILVVSARGVLKGSWDIVTSLQEGNYTIRIHILLTPIQVLINLLTKSIPRSSK